jgi:hypothetical protein
VVFFEQETIVNVQKLDNVKTSLRNFIDLTHILANNLNIETN